jgi:hypothetical protein
MLKFYARFIQLKSKICLDRNRNDSFLETYKAGACLPLFDPFGYLGQLEAVIAETELNDCPQYLQAYLCFSLPSYNLCLPLFDPSGCRGQFEIVNADTLEYFCPQYSQ